METKIKAVDPRVKRTRHLLQQAFMELVNEKGFHAITVGDIAQRAMVNRATFYAHFEDKYALLDDCIREGFQQMLSSRLPHSTTLNTENLRQLILTVFDYIVQTHGHCSPADTQIEPRFKTMIQHELYQILLNWLQKVTTDPSRSASIETIATVISWSIFGAGIAWNQGNTRLTKEETVHQVMAVINKGLSGVL